MKITKNVSFEFWRQKSSKLQLQIILMWIFWESISLRSQCCQMRLFGISNTVSKRDLIKQNEIPQMFCRNLLRLKNTSILLLQCIMRQRNQITTILRLLFRLCNQSWNITWFISHFLEEKIREKILNITPHLLMSQVKISFFKFLLPFEFFSPKSFNRFWQKNLNIWRFFCLKKWDNF